MVLLKCVSCSYWCVSGSWHRVEFAAQLFSTAASLCKPLCTQHLRHSVRV